MPGLSELQMRRYQRIRRAQFARSLQLPEKQPNLSALREFFLRIKTIDNLRVRVHFQGLGHSRSDDIPPNRGESLFNSLIADVRANGNYSVCIALMFSDVASDTSIWEISAEGKSATLAANLLPNQSPLRLSSLIEVVAQSTGKSHSIILAGIRYRYASFDFLVQPECFASIVPARSRKQDPPEKLDQLIALLEEKWDLFYRDVANKQCALTCFSQGTWYVRRHYNEVPVVFREKADLVMLKHNTAVEIIPSVHPQDNLVPVEGVLDLDPCSNDCSIKDTIALSDDFCEFLTSLGLHFHRRISGGPHGGQHFIIPLKLSKPLSLVSSSLKPASFLARHQQELTINSLRNTLHSLVLYYIKQQVQAFPLARKVIFDKKAGHWKIDLKPNSLNSGRRSLFSSHAKTERLVIPIPSESVRNDYFHYQTLADPDIALFQADQLIEANLRTDTIRNSNAKILREIGEAAADLWIAWKSLYPARFRNLYLGGF